MKRFSPKSVAGALLPSGTAMRLAFLAVSLAVMATAPAQADITKTYSNPGTYNDFTVPEGVSQVTVEVSGAGGGGGGPDTVTRGSGGAGAKITATLNVEPGATISLTVGAGGTTGDASSKCDSAGPGGAGYTNGANGGKANCPSTSTGGSGSGGGGGGATALLYNGTPIMLAGGGGGGGGANNHFSGESGTGNSTLARLNDCKISTSSPPRIDASVGKDFTGDGAGGGGGGAGYNGGSGGDAGGDDNGTNNAAHTSGSAKAGNSGSSCLSNDANRIASYSFSGGGGGAGANPNPGTATVSQSGSVKITYYLPPLTLVKSAVTSPVRSTGVQLGDTITYTYVVTNNGSNPITNIEVTDDHKGYGSLSAIGNKKLQLPNSGQSTDSSPASNAWSSLAPGDSVTFTSSYTVVQDDINLLSP